ncbi:MAG TPA: FAD-binding oxidoreductase, partial [Acidimicrobiia bacterium]|nr:FAD-binding oxidoreductase [Acidimicrobiia bacterium]
MWNATADRRPGLVARCATDADVVSALRFARDSHLTVAVRGGGHSYPGFSTCDDGVVIDLGAMRRVTVDAEARIATVEAGALLCDVELVSADGRRVRASDDENPELFWGLRGAGANFGIVTSFRFRLHPAGPDVVAGAAVWPAEQAQEVADTFREWSVGAPDDSTAAFSLFLAGKEFGSDLAGRPIVVIAAVHLGDDVAVTRDLAAIRDLRPALDTFARLPYLSVQTASDDYYAWGRRNYWKGLLLKELPADTITILINRVHAAPSALCGFGMITMGGAVARIA